MLSKAILEELEQFLKEYQYSQLQEPALQMERCTSLPMPATYAEEAELDDYISRKKKPGFTQTLLQMLDARNCKDSVIYTRAGLDRRHFSKIRSNPKYQPSKPTAVALALALELDRNDTDILLATAGYTLSDSDTFDLIIAWCIGKGIYNLHEVNQALDYFSQKTIGTSG